MWKRLRFPIRWKILITLLFLVTAVVGIITFTMARMFHDDKTTYIHDLSAIMAMNTAEESEAMIRSYSELLRTYARIVGTRGLNREEQSAMLRGLFGDFEDLVAISFRRNDEEVAAAYDSGTLEAAGLSREAVQAFYKEHPVPVERMEAGEVYVAYAPLSADLPGFTVSVAYVPEDGGSPGTITAFLRLDGMQRIANVSEIFDVFLVDSQGILLAHTSPEQIGHRAGPGLMSLFDSLSSELSAAMTREYESDGADMVGAFANVKVGGMRAGAQIPKSAAFLASRYLLRNLIFVGLSLLLLATAMSIFWSRRITRSIERLSGATEEIAKGSFDVQVEVDSGDEIGTLAASFNRMASELKTRDEQLETAQGQLVQSEKMAAFGQLGAGIAHEVKNPLAGILGCAQLSLRKVDKDTPIHKNLKLIEKETKRCKEIIENLLKFARQEKAVFSKLDITTVVEDSMAIVRHQLEMKSVKLDAELCEYLPPVYGNANQVQQVLINLMMNAQQAMEESGGGSIHVVTNLLDAEQIEIRVVDDGPGMTEETQKKVFDPFFTTKPGGKGTGLGLSVSFGIIRDHQGHISVQSELGEGATFIIRLPLYREEMDVQNPTPERKAPAVETAGRGY